jgi:hypothetical protein
MGVDDTTGIEEYRNYAEVYTAAAGFAEVYFCLYKCRPRYYPVTRAEVSILAEHMVMGVSVRHPDGETEYIRSSLHGMMLIMMADHVVKKVRQWKISELDKALKERYDALYTTKGT